jgi:two-component system chemotaxis response regulator CheY
MAYDLSDVRILVVDQSSFRRMLICDVLKAIGVEKFEAVDQGTTAYRAASFYIIIAERVMLPLDGLDLACMIRTNPDSPNPTVPVLMIAAPPRTDEVVAARDSGVTEYMAMPFSVTTLYNRLVFIIEQPRQFVRDGEYFGPDRRRSVKDFLGDEKRSGEE